MMTGWTRLWVVALAVAGCGGSETDSVSAPPSGEGFQLKVPEFIVNPGEEIQACYFFAVPGNAGDDVWVNHYEVAQPDGSHHMNIFRIGTIKNLSGKPGESVINGECFKSPNWSDWPLVVNSQQNANTDWKLPDGVGARFKAGEILMLQTHWVNATTQKTNGHAKVAANFWTLKTPPANEMGTMFTTNQNIQICPGDQGRSFTKTCGPKGEQPFHVIAANGHFHSRGTDFQMFTTDPQGAVGSMFYESRVWDDPPMMRTESGQSEIAMIPAGGGVQWKCTFDFPKDPGACGAGLNADGTPNCCYTFGPKVETNEHCNAFVYYWPKSANDTDVNCF
jgi:hypothetical protein